MNLHNITELDLVKRRLTETENQKRRHEVLCSVFARVAGQLRACLEAITDSALDSPNPALVQVSASLIERAKRAVEETSEEVDAATADAIKDLLGERFGSSGTEQKDEG